MSRFLISLLIFSGGLLLMKYAYQMMQFFGKIDWAERYFGGGGTFTFYKVVGLGFIIISLLYLFGALGLILRPLGKIFGNV